MSSILEVEDLKTEFHLRKANVRAVDGVSFHIEAGESLGLVGESGCGKSTTGLSIMKLLPGVGHIVGGSVRLGDRDLASLNETAIRDVRGDEVAMIFQDPMTSLNPTTTIGKQIGEPVRLHRGATKEQARARAIEVLELVGMPRPEERIDYYPHQLSGGLRQRVMIAIALACNPKVLIADEPTTALDVTIQAQILDLIDDLRHQFDMAVLLITHDLGVIARRTDRVMVMYAGKIVEGATTKGVFDHMHHPYAEALLNAIPRLDQDTSQRLYSIPGLPPELSREILNCRFEPRCRYATERCKQEEPLLLPATDDPGHLFACFNPVGSAFSRRRNGSSAGDAAVAVSVSPPTAAEGPDRIRGEPLLEIANLVKEYPVSSGFSRRSGFTVKAVSDVSFMVREGETFGLVGESGCGKTTIGRLVVGLEHPTSGSISFKGDDLTAGGGKGFKAHRRELQLMFQDPYSSLDPRMRVGPILREPLTIQRIGSRSERMQRVSDLLREVGLSPSAVELYPHEFSGGQRQRIGFARALSLEPKVIVADEPVSALDVSIQAQILNLLKALQASHGLTYIVISHDLAVIRYLADTIGVMYLGKLVEIGPATDIYARAAHPYTAGLIEAIPVPDPSIEAAKTGGIRGELPSAVNPPSGCRFRTRCPRAQQICATDEPPLTPFGTEHFAACHFPLQQPVTLLPAAAAGAGGA